MALILISFSEIVPFVVAVLFISVGVIYVFRPEKIIEKQPRFMQLVGGDWMHLFFRFFGAIFVMLGIFLLLSLFGLTS